MEPVIRVNNLVQKTGRKILLKDVSFEVLPGECFGVFGMRGTGKTSLLHVLAGIERFSSGQVEVLGSNIAKSEKFKRDLGLVTQERSLFLDLSVGENLDFIAALKKASRKAIREKIERFELSGFLAQPVMALDTIGAFQRLSLACALLNQPKLLIADELIKDIDLYSRNLILRELHHFQTEGGTCVWAFSDIAYCRYMSRVGWLEGGEMTLYSPEAVCSEWNRQEEFFLEQSGRHHD